MLIRIFLAILFSVCLVGGGHAEQLRFSGYDFRIKTGSGRGPGPNDWARSQAFVDKKGRLHLRFSKKKNRWFASEVESVSRLGYGTYEIEFEGDIVGQDKNVVFGFFNYPPSDVGGDATNEIDIEFARWGDRANKPLNYTVWPVTPGRKNAHKVFSFRKGWGRSIHRFTWMPGSVVYLSKGLRDDGSVAHEAYWAFKPKNPAGRISTNPMPIFFNLWGFRGQAPSDGKNVEVIIHKFSYTPATPPTDG